MDRALKQPPPYALASVDNALRTATMLQLEGELTVSEVAERLQVAVSTAHRLLAMLVYRDFAVHTDRRTYRAGPVLELAAHSHSATSALRTVALPHMEQLVAVVGESVNLVIRTGDTARFIASVECANLLRVGSREGMVFPAPRVTGGMVLLAELSRSDIDEMYAGTDVDLGRLKRDLAKVRSSGFALNNGRSERGVVAVGVAVQDGSGVAVAGLSISMPSVRYDRHRLPGWVAALRFAARAIQADLPG